MINLIFMVAEVGKIIQPAHPHNQLNKSEVNK